MVAQVFSGEEFAVDPLPPATDMNTMNLFHMAAAANPNTMQAGRQKGAATTTLPPQAGGGNNNNGFFDHFSGDVPKRPTSGSVRNRPLPPPRNSPDAFSEFMDDFHFDREFEFSRLGDDRSSSLDNSPELRAEKTTFGEFSMPRDFQKFADVAPPDWLNDSGW